jgi:hypothetical protein
MVKKQQQIKRPNTLLSSQTTLVSPVLGQPCQLNTDPAGKSTPSFDLLETVSGAAVPG